MPSTATNIVNDGNPVNTQVIEATVSGDGSSAVSIRNDGTLILGNTNHHGSISSDNAKVTTDGSGNLTAQNITANGTLSIAGNATLAGLTVGGNTPNGYVTGNFTQNGSSSMVITHGLGSTPSWVGIIETTNANTSFRVSALTSTTFTVNINLATNGDICTFVAVK